MLSICLTGKPTCPYVGSASPKQSHQPFYGAIHGRNSQRLWVE